MRIRELEEQEMPAVADELGITVSAARVRIFRSRALLSTSVASGPG